MMAKHRQGRGGPRLTLEHEERDILAACLVHQMRNRPIRVQTLPGANERNPLGFRGRRDMDVEAEPGFQHLLGPRYVHRLATGRTKDAKALDVIGGELRSQQGVGLTSDKGEEPDHCEDDCGGGSKRGETTVPGGGWATALGRQGLTARLESRRESLGAQTIRAGTQYLTRPALVSGDRTARRARLEVTTDLGALGLGEIAVGVPREQVADAAAIRLHRRPAATGAFSDVSEAVSRSNSIRRPREIRDITVPMGMPNISAISA